MTDRGGPAVEAVLLDVLGTLVELESPGPALRVQLRERVGVEVSEEQAGAAFAAEIQYYLAHQLDGADRASLEDLRDRCAQVVAETLGIPGLDGPDLRAAMLAALRFRPYPDTVPALRELRSRGLRLVAASNWDCSLGDYLAATGLDELLDGAVSSAEVGVTKPDPALFRAALARAGAPAERALHVGDSFERDIVGARAAGVGALLVARAGSESPDGVTTIKSLAELPSVLFER